MDLGGSATVTGIAVNTVGRGMSAAELTVTGPELRFAEIVDAIVESGVNPDIAKTKCKRCRKW